MTKISAVKEFNQYGYRFYPQIWVETLNLWCDLEWVRVKHPQGFLIDAQAIEFAKEGM